LVSSPRLGAKVKKKGRSWAQSSSMLNFRGFFLKIFPTILTEVFFDFFFKFPCSPNMGLGANVDGNSPPRMHDVLTSSHIG
jgi:hypothetical protein